MLPNIPRIFKYFNNNEIHPDLQVFMFCEERQLLWAL